MTRRWQVRRHHAVPGGSAGERGVLARVHDPAQDRAQGAEDSAAREKTGALMAESATPTRKGPRDAIAAVKPMAPPAWRAGMIIGICLKVPALPKPENRNIASMRPRKMWKSVMPVGLVRTQAMPPMVIAMPTAEMKVQMAPPIRSQNDTPGHADDRADEGPEERVGRALDDPGWRADWSP